MKKIKDWLINNFLPQWAKDAMLQENERLRNTVEELKNENSRLRAYIDGLEAGMRAQRRIVINTAADKEAGK